MGAGILLAPKGSGRVDLGPRTKAEFSPFPAFTCLHTLCQEGRSLSSLTLGMPCLFVSAEHDFNT